MNEPEPEPAPERQRARARVPRLRADVVSSARVTRRSTASIPPSRRAALRRRLLGWWSAGHRDLPWRFPPGTADPYRVWLSEVMLQQTRVPAAIPYYLRFVERWPTLRALAAARDDEVFAAWSGLGYYARARNLHRLARRVEAVPRLELRRDEADPAAEVERAGVRPEPEPLDPSRRRLLVAGEEPEERRLPRPAGSGEEDEFGLVDGEREVAKRVQTATVELREVMRFNHADGSGVSAE